VNISYATTGNITRGTFGFCDSTAINTVCTDGVWFNVTVDTQNFTVKGHNKANTLISNTSTSVNLTQGRWYIYKLKTLNTSRTQFQVWDLLNQSLMWTDYADNNIPTAAGRETGAEVMLGSGVGSPSAAVIGHIDYLLVERDENTGRFK
jgi:hypothetical protein